MDIPPLIIQNATKQLRVLMVEDSEDDALLIRRELRRAGYELNFERVDTAGAMSAALGRQEWDVVIADYVMPRFSGLAALELLKKTGPDLPFIIVSAKIGEETAVAAMKAGADDYILKGNLARLVPAIERELRDAVVKRERAQARAAREMSEERFRILTAVSPVGIFVTDAQGSCEYVNQRWCEITGLSQEEALGDGWLSAIYPGDRERVAAAWVHMTESDGEWQLEYRIAGTDAAVTWVSERAKPICDETEEVIGYVGTIADITDEKRAEEHKREFYRNTVLAATQGKLVIADRNEVEELAGLPVASWRVERGDELSEIRHAVTEIAELAGMEDSRIYDLNLSIGEAATNALKHAGGGTISLYRNPDGFVVVIADHGPGIDALVLPDATLRLGYSTGGTLGMGYKAIISVADKVYLATGPGGTSVAIEVGLHARERPLEAAGLPDTWGG